MGSLCVCSFSASPSGAPPPKLHLTKSHYGSEIVANRSYIAEARGCGIIVDCVDTPWSVFMLAPHVGTSVGAIFSRWSKEA